MTPSELIPSIKAIHDRLGDMLGALTALEESIGADDSRGMAEDFVQAGGCAQKVVEATLAGALVALALHERRIA